MFIRYVAIVSVYVTKLLFARVGIDPQDRILLGIGDMVFMSLNAVLCRSAGQLATSRYQAIIIGKTQLKPGTGNRRLSQH